MAGDRCASSPKPPIPRAADSSPARELSADLFRVIAVVVVVLGHWLVSAVTFRDGEFGNDYPIVVIPWTQWLTLPFQVVPVFFLVGGYASAASWTRWRAAGGGRGLGWVRRRVGAILGPTTAYVVLVLAAIAALAVIGVSPSPLSFGGWAVAMHLWFVPVYLLVLALTPLMVAAHERWGLLAPAVLVLAVSAVDLAGRAHLVDVGVANYLLCWGAIYQLGISWHGGALRGRRPVALAIAGTIVLTVLLSLRWYPISMVGVPGAPVQNSSPPTVALLALGIAQAGVLVAVAPAVTRWLRQSRWRRLVAVANKNVMALYLWQMVPVVVVALVAYPAGLLPSPSPGTGTWWLYRAVWVGILTVVTAAELTLLWLGRSVFDRPLPTITVPAPAWSAPLLLVVGLGLATASLSRIGAQGFSPDGRFPFGTALLFAAAVTLLSLTPARRPASIGATGQSG